MKELIVATKNNGKVKEFREMFKIYGIELKSLHDLPDWSGDIVEDGATFEENAAIKAEAISKAYDVPVLADDSGLEVDALQGRPGVYSARYAGEEKNDQKNLEKVLKELEETGYSERTARFVCCIAIIQPGKEAIIKRGTCEGKIAKKPEGSHGFGYDPIFVPDGYDQTMAQLTADEKNAISHRRNAIDKVEQWLKELV
ncbi:non-canonical purine NTP pyrophosphatase [Thalassobacillus devorans]|uniref:dITP/XTP pyrophosphatase n=1 Tax=Thalassobacillus devorans TaxID=279813 RepID=A0ABQ1PAT2_9BACI|nr:XTP/dITP diphosphatase [Thalassobacillus devorans]NIK29827.1 XTP/dITP diphosphohydrolase [Thalassobacillus devorans]GGC93156.1 non-canonical purine NTP pyrophosphatase [Thalassobacillus devorans]